jgi:serine/threonine protein phosphatase PrpC
MAIVADGHGSKKHFRSDIGSKAAVHAVCDTMDNLCSNMQLFESAFIKNPSDTIKKIQKKNSSIINRLINNKSESETPQNNSRSNC